MVPEGGAQDVKTTIVFSASLAGEGTLEIVNPENTKGYDEVVLKGNSPGLGEYTVTITEGRGKHPKSDHPVSKGKNIAKTQVHSLQVEEGQLWQTKALLFEQLKESMQQIFALFGNDNPPPPFQVYTVNHKPGPGNLHFIQKVFEGAFEFDIIFNSGSSGKTLYSSDVSKHIESTHKGYVERLISTFDTQYPFNIESFQRFASNMFSNLIGGLGYFYGDQLIDRSYAAEYEEENEGFVDETAAARAKKQEQREGPYELLSLIPSRPFFPRGFLWDEGFHLLPVIDWDLDLTLEIVKSWFGCMDEDGWIGREQILGAEARSKVPAEFQVQYPHYANPPTLFFIIDEFIAKIGALNGTSPEQKEQLSKQDNYATYLKSTELAQAYLAELYPKLKKHYYWFKKTQHGDLKSYDRNPFSTKEGYRWRGRSVQHILTSGLDDYPRPQPPHPGELHVDLISWMGMMTKSLKNVASFLDYKDDVAELSIIEIAISRNIDDLHWSEKEKVYCDATIDDYEENELVCHKGYISLFPFLTGLIDPESEKLGHILNLIGDKEELWSDYGLRSLSKKDEKYGTNENYWRGPIWINMNYLALKQLLVSPSFSILTPSPPLSPHKPSHSLLTLLLYSATPPCQVPTPQQPKIYTSNSVSSSSRTSLITGKRHVSRGNNIIRRLEPVSERSISRDGRVW